MLPDSHEKMSLLCALKFWISKLNILCKHSSLTNLSSFMQPLKRNLMQFTDCEYLTVREIL